MASGQNSNTASWSIVLFCQWPGGNICHHHDHVHFTSFLGGYRPDSLKGAVNINNHKVRSWPAFKRILQIERFHIAVAPHLDTAFNRARSANKILDHGVFGAANIYSDRSPIAETIEHGINGLLVDDQPSSWRTEILGLIEDIRQE